MATGIAAVMPGPLSFGIVLVFVGLAALTFMTGSTSMMQLTTERAMRGRVLALRIAVAMGGTPLFALNLVCWPSEQLGPDVLVVGAVFGAGVLISHVVGVR